MSEKKKTIGIVVRGTTVGGAGRYVMSLLAEFARIDTVQLYVFSDIEKPDTLSSSVQWVHIPKRWRLIWDYVVSVKHMRRYTLDWIVYPKQVIPLSHVLISGKKMVVIHDIAYFNTAVGIERTTDFFDTWYMRFGIWSSCCIAHRIVSVSEFTRRELIEHLHVGESRVSVVGEGVDTNLFFPTSETPVQDGAERKKPYMLYPGSFIPRKNTLRLLQAFATVMDEIPHDIYMTGIKHDSTLVYGSADIFAYLKENPVVAKRVHMIGTVSDQELAALYRQADFCAYPSIYEGYGLPILEAQASGCPVLTSDKSACREVSAGIACLVDPLSVENIAQGIRRLATDTDYRSHLRHDGIAYAQSYTWKRVADELSRLCV